MKRESVSSGGALLVLVRGCPGPWKELVEAIVRPEIDEADENIGKIGLGLDVIQFAGLYQRRDDGPIFSTIIVTGERAFLRVRACGRIERSTMLVSSSMRPSSRKRVRPSQCLRP